jgi:ATP-dependent protease HslVU (ClpYQ) peptidase subunit
MTCIVGFVDKKNKNVLIGGDSAAIANYNIGIRKDKKVFRVGEFIIGCSGSFRMIQLLAYSFVPPDITKDIYEYMCTDFITSIRECFKDGGYLQKYIDGGDRGGTFLVGYKNRLFTIDEDFQVAEHLKGVDACGDGAPYALGVIHCLYNTSIPAKEKVLKALKAAEFFFSGCFKTIYNL